MTQKEFIKNVTEDVNKQYKTQKKSPVTQGLVGDVIESSTNVIKTAVKKGDKIQISGFGIFEQVTRNARDGRNPVSGEKIKIPAKKAVKFKASKAFKDAINGGK